VAAPSGSGYQVTKTVPIPGEDGWDYMFVDSDARRGYVSHGTRVVVIDIDSLQIIGTVDDTQGVHGIAVAPELGRGFASDGRANTVTIFDTKTLKTIGTVKAGTNPDAIIFDPVSKRVFAMNGRSGDVTAIDAATGNVPGTMPVGGKLEFAVADGKGSMFVNVEDKSELIEFDSKALKVLHRWPLAPCESPSGLSMDRANRRLFLGCENKMMAVVDADSGKVIATPAIGDGVDATAFDPGLGYAFASNGEGTLTVVKEESPSSFSVIDNVPTRKSARTMGLDLKSHTVFLPFADFDPPAPGERRGKMKPGSFALLVVERK
jgi:YVTN family beta-propeller protein